MNNLEVEMTYRLDASDGWVAVALRGQDDPPVFMVDTSPAPDANPHT